MVSLRVTRLTKSQLNNQKKPEEEEELKWVLHGDDQDHYKTGFHFDLHQIKEIRDKKHNKLCVLLCYSFLYYVSFIV